MMMFTGIGSFQVAGSLAQSHGLSDRADEYPVPEPEFGPFDLTQDVRRRIERLMAGRLGNMVNSDEPSADATVVEHGDTGAAPTSPSPDADGAAKLEGIRLAAREIAHLVNNDLAVTVGTLDLLRTRCDVPPQVRDLLDQALAGLSAASSHVEQLQRVQRVVTRETPAGPSLDLDKSL
jgi:hypothetical protein